MVFNGESDPVRMDLNCLRQLVTATPEVIQTLKEFIDKQEPSDKDIRFINVFQKSFSGFTDQKRSRFICT